MLDTWATALSFVAVFGFAMAAFGDRARGLGKSIMWLAFPAAGAVVGVWGTQGSTAPAAMMVPFGVVAGAMCAWMFSKIAADF